MIASTANRPAENQHAARIPAELAAASWPRFIFAYLLPFRRRFALLAVMLLAGIGLQLALPQIISRFIDHLSVSAHANELVLLGAVVLAAALVNLVAGGLATYLGQDVGWAATNLMREDLARHLLGLDMRYHNTHTPGEFIERIDGDLNQLSTFFSILMIQVLGSGLLLLGTLVLLFLADWRMGLALAGFIVLAFTVLIKLRSVAVPAGIQEREVSAGFLGFLEERLTGVEDIRTNGGGDYVMDRFYTAMRSWYTQSVRAWTRRASVWAVSTLLFSLGIAVTLALSTYLYLSLHAITLGTAYLFFQYIILLRAPVEQISQQMQEFQKAASSLIRVRGQLGLKPEITDGLHADRAAERPATSEPSGALAVRFDHVTFAYSPEDEPVLHDVDFELPAGEVLGLLGRTGSGKTTISRLIFRLYDVTQGTI
ncbi:MAG: ABC transporter ATP-binding protein, partial [Chloroflexota bacterium]